MENPADEAPAPREDPDNRFNREFKGSRRTRFRLVLRIGVGLVFQIKLPHWFPFFGFAYGLYFFGHLADRISFRQRLHQIGNEVAIMAISKNLGLWDEAITEQVNEYLHYRSLDISINKLWRAVRERDW